MSSTDMPAELIGASIEKLLDANIHLVHEMRALRADVEATKQRVDGVASFLRQMQYELSTDVPPGDGCPLQATQSEPVQRAPPALYAMPTTRRRGGDSTVSHLSAEAIISAPPHSTASSKLSIPISISAESLSTNCSWASHTRQSSSITNSQPIKVPSQISSIFEEGSTRPTPNIRKWRNQLASEKTAELPGKDGSSNACCSRDMKP
ncbi:unnamed protein product, partial [Mesorhabditis spiculigera]